MRIRIGKILPVLALGIAMSEGGMAREQSMGASANTVPHSVIADNQTAVGPRRNTEPMLRVSLQENLTRTSEVRAIVSATEIGYVPTDSAGKTSALVLSSLGMLSVISLLRLNRAL